MLSLRLLDKGTGSGELYGSEVRGFDLVFGRIQKKTHELSIHHRAFCLVASV